MSTWENKDGLKVNFNRTLADQHDGGVTAGAKKRVVFRYDSQAPLNSETAGNTDGRELSIPANAYITDAYFIVETAFTSGGSTTLTVGLAQDDGTVIDADGLDATVAKTAIDAVGDVVVMDGALVGGTSVVGNEAFLYFTVGTGPWTAGVGHVVIEYIEPQY